MNQDIISRVELVTKAGKTPKIATFRIGDDDGEKYYEESLLSESWQIWNRLARSVVLDEGVCLRVTPEELVRLNNDDNIDELLSMLMPFPKSIDGERLR